MIPSCNGFNVAGTEQRVVPSQAKGHFVLAEDSSSVDVPKKESLGPYHVATARIISQSGL
jgi:hypothetical protein